MPYAPSPSIPPGMSPAAWKTVTDAAAKEAAWLAGQVQSGKPLPRDVQVRIALLGRTTGDLSALNNDPKAIADYVLGQHFGPQLQASLDALTVNMPSHAIAAAGDSRAYMAANGYMGGVSPDVLQAVAQRTNQAITHDWTRLTANTQQTLRDNVARGMVAGLNPREVARRVQREVVDGGGMTYARALLIARTEMGDTNDAAVMAGMAGVDGVVGWTWDAQPDACATCQVMHGLVYAIDDLPQRHHNCRCTVVPVFEDEGTAVGDYLPGQQRPRHEVESRLPASWQPLPSDLRVLADLRDNPGWRKSRTLRKPRKGDLVNPPKGKPVPEPPTQPQPVAAPTHVDVALQDSKLYRDAAGNVAVVKANMAYDLKRLDQVNADIAHFEGLLAARKKELMDVYGLKASEANAAMKQEAAAKHWLQIVRDMKRQRTRIQKDLDTYAPDLARAEAQLRLFENASWADMPKQGPPIDIPQAALGTNDRWRYGAHEYGVNCTRCAATFELRRRGYDVAAMPAGNEWRWTKFEAQYMDMWRNPDGSTPKMGDVPNNAAGMTAATAGMPVGARGFVRCAWKGGGGHIFNWEVTEDGWRFVEGQIDGKAHMMTPEQAKDYMRQMKSGTMQIVRMDEALPTQMLSAWVQTP